MKGTIFSGIKIFQNNLTIAFSRVFKFGLLMTMLVGFQFIISNPVMGQNYIEQLQSSGTLGLEGSGTGQSFTATVDGVIQDIQVVTTGIETLTLDIYEGSGNGGNLLHSQQIHITNSTPNFQTFTLDNDVSVSQNSVYTFLISGVEGFDDLSKRIAYQGSNPYEGGVAYYNGSIWRSGAEDLKFRITIMPPSPFAGGSGTEADPYQVATVEQLDNVRNFLDSHFIQTADIDLGVSPWNDGEGWDPIADSNNPFTGNFNGQGHTISDLFIDRADEDYIGLFGFLNEGLISNLGVENADISGRNNVGGLVGVSRISSTISGIYSTGSINGTHRVGGLVGNNYASSTVSTSYFAGSVEGSSSVAGLVGMMEESSTVSKSYFTGSVNGTYDVGGLVGWMTSSSVMNSYSTGSINGTNRVGGLVGNSTMSTVTNSFWDKDTSGQISSQGSDDSEGKTTAEMKTQSTFTDAGWDFANTWGMGPAVNGGYPYLQSLIKNIPPTATNVIVSGSLTYDQELTGEYDYNDDDGDDEGTTTYQWYRSDDVIGNNKSVIDGATTKTYTTTTEDIGKYISFEVTPHDGIAEGEAVESSPQGPVASPFAAGSGTEGEPYELSSPEQLAQLGNFPEAHFKLSGDIDLDVAPYNEGEGWKPVGDMDTPFTGVFDGGGFAFTGLTINRPDEDNIGFFGVIEDADIKNITMQDVSVVGKNSVGALAGNSSLSSLAEITIAGSTTGSNNVGGMVGLNSEAQILNSSVTGEVIGDFYTGGLVGYNQNNAEISSSFTSVELTSNGNGAGGLVGMNVGSSRITDSYAMGSVSSTGDNMGGLAGENLGSAEIENSYAAGPVSGSNNVGGLVGNNGATITGSFWDTETGGPDNGTGNGLSTEEMKDITTFTDAGWNFDTAWQIKEPSTGSISYPYFQDNAQDPAPGLQEVSDNADLAALVLSNGTLDPIFDQGTTSYTTDIDYETSTITITPTASDDNATISIEEETVAGGSASEEIELSVGVNSLSIEVTAENSTTTKTYTVEVNRESPFAGGKGTEADPYQIATAEQLDQVRDFLDKHFLQTTDINLDVAPYNQGGGWEPIGIRRGSFVGSYDGGGHAIDGLYLTLSQPNQKGLFFRLNGDVHNLKLTNVDFSAQEGGALANVAEDVSISNIEVSGTVLGRVTGTNGPDIGGLFGNYTATTPQSISDIKATITVTGGGQGTGGIIGRLSGEVTINNVASLQEVSGINASGGIIGLLSDFNGSISNSYTTGTISGVYAGGIFGATTGQVVVENSYTTGNIDGSTGSGGIIGLMVNSTANDPKRINNSYATGELDGGVKGGLIGQISGTTSTVDLSNSFWDTNSTGVNSSVGDGTVSETDGMGVPTTGMKRPGTYTDASWDFDTIWEMENPKEGSISYPDLKNNTQDPAPGYRIENLPVAENVEVPAEPEYKATLEASYTYTDADGDDEAGTTLQWYTSDDGNETNKQAIDGATSLTYTLTKADVHKYISFEVTPNDGYVNGETVSVMVGEAQSPFAGGYGTEADPYQIATAEQLDYVRDFLEDHFLQTDDIDLGIAPYNQGEGWEPIGSVFIGTYNGGNHAISNLYIDSRERTGGIGLFTMIGSETLSEERLVYDLKLQDVDVTSYRSYTGGLAGRLNAGVDNIIISGKFSGDMVIGAISGLMHGGEIANTHSSADITGNGATSIIGGLIGSTQPKSQITLYRSSSTGDIIGNRIAGGLFGVHGVLNGVILNEAIIDSYFAGNLEGKFHVGGLIGTDASGTDVQNSYVIGNIKSTGVGRAGGIAGFINSQSDPVISNTYVAAKITSDQSGAIFGQVNTAPELDNVYWDTTATTQTSASISGNIAGATGLGKIDMRLQDSFPGFDFTNTWQIEEMESGYISYPYLNPHEADSIPGRLKVDPPTLAEGYTSGNIGSMSASYSTEALSDGNLPVTERGLSWSLNNNFSGDTVMVKSDGEGLGDFTTSLDQLPPFTTIYVRSYAKNLLGTSFGPSTSLKTEKQELDLTGDYTVINKIYDGTHTAQIDQNNIEFHGEVVYPGHSVELSNLQLEFEESGISSKNTLVSIVSAELAGADAGRYTLSLTEAPTSFATIRKRPITVAGNEVSVIYGSEVPETSYQITDGSLVEGEELMGEVERTGDNNAGNYTIVQGTLTADSNYELTFEEVDFIIEPKALTITPENKTKEYGETDPELTVAYDGFAGTEEASALSGTLAIERETGEDVREYEISASGLGAQNYDIDYIEGIFTINKKGLTISAHDTTKVYGEEDPQFTFSYAGFIEGEGLQDLEGELTFGREDDEDVGKYTVEPTGFSSINYAVEYESAILEITQKDLVVAARDTSKIYGDENPDFPFNATGFEYSDDASVLSGALNKEEGEDVGEYEVMLGTLSNHNYAIDFTSATVNITPAELVIKADSDITKFEGEDDPILSYSAEGFKWDDDETILAGALTREDGETPGFYTIDLGSIEAGENYEVEFITNEFRVYKTPPVFSRLYPGNETSGFPINSALAVVFDQEVELEEASNIVLLDEEGISIDVQVSVEEDSLVIIPEKMLSNQTEYRIITGNDAVANTDGFGNSPFEWSFTTIMSGPVVDHTFPEGDQESVLTDTTLRIAFNQPVTINDESKISITGEAGEVVQVEEVSIQNDTLIISHIGLEHLTNYTVSLEEGMVLNADDVFNESYSWSFKTIVPLPEVVSLEAPQDSLGSVQLGPVYYSWGDVEHAESFQIQVSEDAVFDALILNESDLLITEINSEAIYDLGQVYYWRVRASNVSGNGPWSQMRMFVTQPEIPVALFPANEAENISIAPFLRLNEVSENSGARIQLAPDEDLSEVLIDTVINGVELQLSGLNAEQNYYWRSKTIDSQQSVETRSEWSQVQVFTTRSDPNETDEEPVTVTVDFGETSGSGNGQGEPGEPGQPDQIDPQQTDYRMVGLPGMDGIALGDFFSGPYRDSWRAFIETGDNADFYEEYDPEDERFTFTPGMGFWVLSTEIITDDFTFTSVDTDARDSYGFPVHPGWNIIANPFQSSVEWSLVEDFNEINASLFGYQEQFVETDSLKPFTGYYYYNDPALDKDSLFIPYAGFDQRGMDGPAPKDTVMFKQAGKMTLQITHENGRDSEVEMVFGSSPELLEFEKAHPALAQARRGMALTHNEESNKRLRYKRLTGMEQDAEASYLLEVKATVGSETRWNLGVSEHFNLQSALFVNKATQQAFIVDPGVTKKVTITEPLSSYQLFVGERSYLMDKQQSLAPKAFELSQNYPNPFNPVTNIRYSVPERTNLTLEIYDLLGRKVQTLVSGSKQAGWHVATWDASSLSSGMYLYRIQAGDYTQVKKLTLIK